MKILLSFRQDVHKGIPVECYPRSFLRVLNDLGHQVTCIGEGHLIDDLDSIINKPYDAFIEIDNGRNQQGDLALLQPKLQLKIPSAVWFIDSHNPKHGEFHKSISKYYSHIFFAVWNKRDLFTDHSSSHWCPNSTDARWFDYRNYSNQNIEYDFAFISSKDGLIRADPLKQVLDSLGYTYDIRQVSKAHRHKWPAYPVAMSKAIYLYNWGQKNDGPNQRVMESLALRKPLLNDNDPKSGLSKVLTDGVHYIGYNRDFSDLKEKVIWTVNNPEKVMEIARLGYEEVMKNHLINNRVNQILEVLK